MIKYFKLSFLLSLLCFIGQTSLAQIDSLKESYSVDKKKLAIVYGSNVVITGGTWWFLWDSWFTDEPSRSFHIVNDNAHWMQMDKLGHGFSAYYIAAIWASELRWANMSYKKSAIYGSLASWLSVNAIDVMDGFSSRWGFSPGDIAANTFGTALYLGQGLAWGEQRIHFKYSYHPTNFTDLTNKLGDGWYNYWLHDYNGQTYWLSANLHDFSKGSNIPRMLNVAVGYGAHNMLAELETPEEILLNESKGTKRIRQFYLSPDLDLTKIKTDSKFVKILLQVVNAIKVPMPALEYNTEGNLKFHWLYF